MKLQKRNNIWHIRYRDERGENTSVSTHCHTQMEAQEFLARWIRDGQLKKSKIKTVADVLNYYYDNSGKFKKSARRIGIANRKLIKYFKDTLWVNFNNSYTIQYQLQSEQKSSTIRYELNQIRTAQNYCIDDGVLLPQYKKKFELPKKGKGDDYTFNDKDIESLWDRFKKKPHIILFMEIAINTSARKKHILDLEWTHHIDLVKRLIYFNKLHNWGTTKKGGIVKMNDRLYNVLIDAQKVSQSKYVINYAGKKVKHLSAMQTYKRATMEDKFMTKTFRHTAATWAAEAGISMEEIATMTGHTDKKTTETYVHLTPNYQKNMVKVIEDKMRRGKNGANRFLSIDKEKKETKNKTLKAD